MLLAVMGALGAGYGLLYNSHVRVDIFSKMLPTRGQPIMGLITDLLTVITIGWLTWYLFREAIGSTLSLEHSSSVWAPPLYPERVVVAIGFLFLTLQVICAMLKNIIQVMVKPNTEVISSGAAS